MMTKAIPLTKGKVAIVDDIDYEYLSQWKWHYNSRYAMRNSPRDANGKQTRVIMHRLILGTPDGLETDHINHDTLDNRRSNLRICTPSQNQANKSMQRNNSSGRRGVDWFSLYGKWRARISISGRETFLGLFDSLDDAANAYAEKAKEVFGDFVYNQEEMP